jgi:hypothetical protein
MVDAMVLSVGRMVSFASSQVEESLVNKKRGKNHDAH